MAKTIAICNQKGGVGKTTTTLNLGIGLVREGKKVLLVDGDPQNDLTSALGWDADGLENSLGRLMYLVTQNYKPIVKDAILHHPEGVDLIPSNLDLSSMETQLVNAMSREKVLSNLLKDVKKDYDYILIDCMPSLGMITINALTAADSVIIPVQAQYLPAKGMTQLMRSIDMVRNHTNDKLQIGGIVMTLVDSRTNLAREVIDKIRTQYGMQIRIFDTQIPVAVKAAEASKAGVSIFSYDKDSKPANKDRIRAWNREHYKEHRDEIREKQKKRRKERLDEARARDRKYYHDHRDEICARVREYRKENRDKINAREREYYKEHREEILANNKEYRDVNKDRINARTREYRKAHLEEVRAKEREYKKKHRDEINARQREYRKEHRDEINAKQRAYYKARREREKQKDAEKDK